MKLPSSLFVLLFLVCCGSPHPSEKVARDFMEAYYVRTDLKGASSLAEGLALSKIEESVTLTQGAIIDAATRRPEIAFELTQAARGEDTAIYLFRVTIRPEGAVETLKESRLRLRRQDGTWKVTQFSDFERGT